MSTIVENTTIGQHHSDIASTNRSSSSSPKANCTASIDISGSVSSKLDSVKSTSTSTVVSSSSLPPLHISPPVSNSLSSTDAAISKAQVSSPGSASVASSSSDLLSPLTPTQMVTPQPCLSASGSFRSATGFLYGSPSRVGSGEIFASAAHASGNSSTSSTSGVSSLPSVSSNHGSLTPTATPQPHDFAHDLPVSLLNAGWRKFWSKREGRPYYYNKVTSQSLWEMPPDPATMCNGAPTKRRSSQENPQHVVPLKRSSIDITDRYVGSTMASEHQLGAIWNPRVISNVTHSKRPQTVFLPADPQIELHRALSLQYLRKQYVSICHNREGIVPATGSFNRWLLQMKVEDLGYDPVFPSRCHHEVSASMKRELLHALPTPLSKPKYSNEARGQLIKYVKSAKLMVDTRNASPESRKTVKWNVEETNRWLRSHPHLTFDDLVERLTHLKRQCQPHIAELARDSIEKICSKVFSISKDYAMQLREMHISWLEKVGVQIPADKQMSEQIQWHASDFIPSHAPPHSQFSSQAASLLCACPMASGHIPDPASFYPITLTCGSELVDVEYVIAPTGVRFTLSRPHYEKLMLLYRRKAEDDPSLALLPQRLWCLLQRYHSYMGCESGETDGFTNQAALPIPVFDCLHRVFDVTFELFASPLNCYFPQFCSAFPDTDGYFGSCGPILNFFPESGSFEANPPFCEELLLNTVDHLESLLEASSLPLSFIVFMPEWRDPPYEALTKLESSRFKRTDVSLPALEHEYRLVNFPPTLNQNSVEVSQRSNHDTLVVFLQNDAGFQKWTPTASKIKEVVTTYLASMKKTYSHHNQPVTQHQSQTTLSDASQSEKK